MKNDWIRKNNSGFLGLLSLVFTLAIICFISYLTFKVYFKKPIAGEWAGESSSVQGAPPSNYQSVLSSTRNKIEGINKKHLNELNQLDDSR